MKYFDIFKNLIRIAIFFGISNLNAQDTWSVDLARTRPSLDAIRLEQIDLTKEYTVVYMSYFNVTGSRTFIEACNTFHIRSDGKRVAEFITAENVPVTDQRGKEFECADPNTAMSVPAGKKVYFRLFFTPIPSDLKKIDLIEYDGTRSCEFDVFNLNITQKEKLKPFTKATFKTAPTIARNNTTPPKKTPPPVPAAKKPAVTTKKPVEKAKENPVIAEKPATKTNKKPIAERSVAVKEQFKVEIPSIEIEIWDNDQEDGDEITVTLNGRLLVQNFSLKTKHRKIRFPVREGKNKLIVHADNLGSAPPNTASLSFFDGKERHYINLSSNFESSEAIEFIYQSK
ncbi:MAG: hypothetical protein RL757_2276 [Bacteroidota bacterium]|jgi:hypothetical protein